MADATDAVWRSTRTAPLSSYFPLSAAITEDPWARNLIVTAGSGAGSTRVLSAGPNGIVETPFAPGDAARVSGDDIAARVR